jgi:hypothetical protein
MASQYPTLASDAHLGERDEVSALAALCGITLSADFLRRLLEWHHCKIEAAQRDAWVPGATPIDNAQVEEVIRRYHLHGFSEKIAYLQRRNRELMYRKSTLLDCVRFYAAGTWDGGNKARALVDVPAAAVTRGLPRSRSH